MSKFQYKRLENKEYIEFPLGKTHKRFFLNKWFYEFPRPFKWFIFLSSFFPLMKKCLLALG